MIKCHSKTSKPGLTCPSFDISASVTNGSKGKHAKSLVRLTPIFSPQRRHSHDQRGISPSLELGATVRSRRRQDSLGIFSVYSLTEVSASPLFLCYIGWPGTDAFRGRRVEAPICVLLKVCESEYLRYFELGGLNSGLIPKTFSLAKHKSRS
jgi:hypothetical protein